MVVSMVDVGEQTGALPEMLMKIADNYDEEVDNAVAAMTSLLEPIMIVFLAVIVGSIVIALFLPLITLMENVGETGGEGAKTDKGESKEISRCVVLEFKPTRGLAKSRGLGSDLRFTSYDLRVARDSSIRAWRIVPRKSYIVNRAHVRRAK